MISHGGLAVHNSNISILSLLSSLSLLCHNHCKQCNLIKLIQACHLLHLLAPSQCTLSNPLLQLPPPQNRSFPPNIRYEYGAVCIVIRSTPHTKITNTHLIFLSYYITLVQKTSFQGLSLSDAKRVFSIAVTKRSSLAVRRKRRGGLEISARTASKNIEVEVDKPLGLTLGQKPAGGVVITVSRVLVSPLLFPCTVSVQHRKS